MSVPRPRYTDPLPPPEWDPQYTDPPLPPPDWPPKFNGVPLEDLPDFDPMTPTGPESANDGNPFDFEPLEMQVPGMPPPPKYPALGKVPANTSGNAGLAADAALAERVRNEAYSRAMLEHDTNLQAAVSDLVTAGEACERANDDIFVEYQTELIVLQSAAKNFNLTAMTDATNRIRQYLTEMQRNNDYLDTIQKTAALYFSELAERYSAIPQAPYKPGMQPGYQGGPGGMGLIPPPDIPIPGGGPLPGPGKAPWWTSGSAGSGSAGSGGTGSPGTSKPPVTTPWWA